MTLGKDDFRGELERLAKKKRALATTKKKAGIVPKPAVPAPELLTKMSTQLDEIQSVLNQPKAGDPVKFVVTERDEKGKIKAFEVEK